MSRTVASLALERVVRSPAALVENLPIGVYTCDRGGRIVQFNRRAEELWGRAPRSARYCGAPRKLEPDGSEVAAENLPVAVVLRTGKPVRDRELVLERADGTRLTILVNADPVYDDSGTLVGAVDCFQDISELTRIRRQVKEGRRAGRHVMEALPAAIYTTDAEGKLLYFNRAAEKLWGFRPETGDPNWWTAWTLRHADGRAMAYAESPMALALRDRQAMVGPEAIAERPDGTRIPFLPHPTPIFDSTGTLIGAVNMLADLTEQKRATEQQRGLIDELNHRVKNTLATIQSLAAHTMRGASAQDARAFEERLLALSRVHDQLSNHSWEWADFAAIARQSFSRAGNDARIRFDGPALRLRPKTALAVAMVLRELAANAEAHGALSVETGSLELAWRIAGEDLVIDWREQGGPPVGLPEKRGFGTRLVERSIAEELKGSAQIDYAASGLHCTLTIPVPQSRAG